MMMMIEIIASVHQLIIPSVVLNYSVRNVITFKLDLFCKSWSVQLGPTDLWIYQGNHLGRTHLTKYSTLDYAYLINAQFCC